MLLASVVGALAVALGLLGAIGAFASGGAPGVETERAEQVTRTTAVLTATVEPNGATTECKFEYGTSEGSLNKTAPCAFPPGERPIRVPEYAQLGGLSETTTYFFRITAKNENGSKTGAIKELHTLPNLPRANTEPATEVKHTSATLTGYVTPNESEVTECFFSYGTEAINENKTAPCEPSKIAAGGEPSEAKFVSAKISGLSEKTKYFYRVHAKNAIGEDKGGNNNFTTQPSGPNPGQLFASKVERTTAVLHGIVIPDGAKVETCTFEYGPPVESNETPLEKTIPCESLPPGEGEAKEPVSVELTGLSEATHYEFRLKATNSLGEGHSGNNGFTTRPTAPNVEMHHAKNVTNEAAELSASVNPEGGEVTQCFFEYGTTRALGKVASCSALPGEGEKYVQVGAKITGLEKGTEYLVRIVAVNAGGVGRGGEGEKHNFITSNGTAAPVVEKVKPKKGPAKGGNTVTIKGKNFEHVVAVFFGPNEATVTKSEVLKLEVTAPPGVGKVGVTVLTEAGTSEPGSGSEYLYGKPELTSISPNEGPLAGGTVTTIKGFGFELGAHGTTFEFGKGNPSSEVECTSTTECTVVTPKGPKANKSVNVQAKVNGLKSTKVAFKYNE